MSDHATTDTREIIVEILLSLEKGQDFSHKLMKAVLDKYDYLDPREKAFIKRVTEGTIERQLELDYYLDRFSSVPVRKMKPLIRCLLRMSTYQILYMDAVPDSAVCNEACKLAAKRGFRTLKGFVNAVLRNISRSKEQMPLPDPKDTVKYLSIKYSMPEWIVNLWLPAYGREGTETLLKGLLSIHPVSLRFSTELTEAERESLAEKIEKTGVRLQQSRELPYVYLAQNLENVSELPGFAEGKFHVQDLSSQLLCAFVSPQPGERLADVCAAPGGKSFTLSEYMENTGVLDACDVYKGRVNLIKKGAERLGLSIIHAAVRDAATGVCEKQYDRVLCDVPCSGLGVIRRKPEIRYKKQESFKELPALQLKILEHSAQLVRPGGILFYSTCTLRNAENGAVVTEFLKCHPEFEPYDLPETEGISHTVNEPKFMRTMMPMDHGGDGFFAAAMRRKTETGKETKR